MNELASTITSKGQVTIPAAIRKHLGLKRGDKITFVLADHEVLLRRTGSVVAATAGVLKSDRPALSAEELRAAAADAIAASAAQRGGA